jgi:hypothetical protein
MINVIEAAFDIPFNEPFCSNELVIKIPAASCGDLY